MDFIPNICCLCLNKNNISLDLNCAINTNETYYQKIKAVFPELDFGETTDDCKLCSHCCEKINLVYNFKKKCFSSLQVFLSYRANLSIINQANSSSDLLNIEFQRPIIENKFEILENVSLKPDIHSAETIAPQNGNSDILKPQRVVEDDEFSISSESKNSDITKTISEVLLSDLSDTALNASLEENLEDLEIVDAINQSEVTKFECTICKKEFMYFSALHKHQKSHKLIYNPTIENTETPKESEISNIYDIEDEILKTSVQTTEISNKPYECQICFRKFSQFSSLISHQKIHSSAEPQNKKSPKKSPELSLKSFKCKVCSKTFNKRKSLNDHKEVHLIGLPFECEICQQKFDAYSVLINHRKKHL